MQRRHRKMKTMSKKKRFLLWLKDGFRHTEQQTKHSGGDLLTIASGIIFIIGGYILARKQRS